MSESIRIAVAMHKPYRTPDDPAYLPLHVGAALHPDVLPGIQGDDEGDNISRLNASYSELTALYWMWKNCDAGLQRPRALPQAVCVPQSREPTAKRPVRSDRIR